MALATSTATARPRCGWCCSRAPMKARLRLLHRLRQPQGRRARCEPARSSPLPLGSARAPGARRGSVSSASPGRSPTPTSPRGRAVLSSQLPRHSRAPCSGIAPRSTTASPSSPVSTRAATCGGPITGAAIASCPEAYEFWQHRDDRMHDRLRYRRANGDWVVERLSP